MKRHPLPYTALVVALFPLTICSVYAQTGSTVTIPTSYVTLYVDSAFTGTTVDGPNGTYKSIQPAINHALYQNRIGKNVRVLIKKGNGYRESVNLTDSGATTRTLTLEAFDANNKPVIYGSDNWNGATFGMSPPLNGNQVYYHPCNTPQGVQVDIWANPNDPTVDQFIMPLVIRRSEVMILRFPKNGVTQVVPMKRVLSYGEMVPGAYYVHEDVGVSGYSNFFFMLPTDAPSGSSIGQVSAEVGVRSNILSVSNRQNLILKNINFQTASDYFGGAVQINNCRNVRVEGCAMDYSCSKGLVIDNDTNITVTGCSFNSNGIAGLAGGFTKNLLLRNSSSNGNNWRGFQGGLAAWDSAGAKFYKIHDSKVDTLTANDNQGACPGLWLDTDVKNVTVSNLNAQRNDIGLFYEAAQGPLVVNLQTTLSNNRYIGLLDASANNLTLDGCIIGNNGTSNNFNTALGQVICFGSSAGRRYQDFELLRIDPNTPISTVYGENFVIRNSKIYWNLDTSWHPIYASSGDVFSYQRFMATLTASGNQYWHKDPNTPWVFQRYDGSFTNGIFANWKVDLAAQKPAGTVVESGSTYSIIP